MRILLHTDLEGAAGVSTFAQCGGRGAPPEASARRALTGEVNASVAGILDEEPGAEILVRDGHGAGGLDPAGLDARASLIPKGSQAGLDRSFAALFFVGQHARAGARGANLPHTFSHREIEFYRLNGRPVGEFHLHAYRAGTVHGVPAAFLSGDRAAVAEALALVPELVGVAVKEALGPEQARPLPDEEARRLIRRGAAEAVRRVRAGQVRPVRLEPPYLLEIRARAGEEAVLESFVRRGAERVDARTVLLRSNDARAILRGSASVAL